MNPQLWVSQDLSIGTTCFTLLGKWVAAFPPTPPPPSTDYLRQGWVEEGFTFFSHLKRKEGPSGKQPLLSHIQALQYLSHFHHVAIDGHFYHGKHVLSEKKNTEKCVLMVPNRVWKIIRNYSLLYWPSLIHQRWEYHHNSHHNISQYLQFL